MYCYLVGTLMLHDLPLALALSQREVQQSSQLFYGAADMSENSLLPPTTHKHTKIFKTQCEK